MLYGNENSNNFKMKEFKFEKKSETNPKALNAFERIQ